MKRPENRSNRIKTSASRVRNFWKIIALPECGENRARVRALALATRQLLHKKVARNSENLTFVAKLGLFSFGTACGYTCGVSTARWRGEMFGNFHCRRKQIATPWLSVSLNPRLNAASIFTCFCLHSFCSHYYSIPGLWYSEDALTYAVSTLIGSNFTHAPFVMRM